MPRRETVFRLQWGLLVAPVTVIYACWAVLMIYSGFAALLWGSEVVVDTRIVVLFVLGLGAGVGLWGFWRLAFIFTGQRSDGLVSAPRVFWFAAWLGAITAIVALTLGLFLPRHADDPLWELRWVSWCFAAGFAALPPLVQLWLERRRLSAIEHRGPAA